ncbi:MAG: PEGA domain-containing protein [Patescibacteria group bacterium]|nr:PEGA domain-containing protein [Patescibacteria group bacterium]
MTRRTRRILYLSFILMFFILAPILVLYSSGYRFDWSRKQLLKTALLRLNTEPGGATVYVNGQPQKNKTPTAINNLLPGTYDIRVEKDGYLPWQNSISLKSKTVEFLTDITLFRDTSPELVLDKTIGKLTALPDSNEALFVTPIENGFELNKLNLANQKETNMLTRPTEINIETEAVNNHLIISSLANGLPVYEDMDITVPEKATAINWAPKDISKLQWLDNKSFFGIAEGVLCQIFLEKPEFNCAGPAVTEFLLQDKYVYYLSSDIESTLLYRAPINNLEGELIVRLPKSEDYRFIPKSEPLVVFIDGQTEDLVLIDPENTPGKITTIPRTAKDAFWHEAGEQLVYYNDFEIWRWNIETDERTLLTRLSEPIQWANRYGWFDYVIFSQEKNIQALELESHTPSRTTTSLVNNATGHFILDRESKNLFYIGSNGDRLWKRPLR